MTALKSLADEFKRLASERGMSIDALVERARDVDRAGYAPSTLREMLYSKRSMQLRAIYALSEALDVDLTDHDEYQLRLVRYLTDESNHGIAGALKNLRQLQIRKLPDLTKEEIQRIPINHRQIREETIDQGSALASRAAERVGT